MQLLCFNYFTTVPDQPPLNVNGSSTIPESLYFTWSPPLPENQNGFIVRYDISLTTVDTSMDHSTNNTYINITDLSPFTTYTFVVAARTSLGVGPFSLALTITTNENGNY